MSTPGSFLHYLRRLLQPAEAAEQSDGDLLRRYTATRDETAFEALLERHGPMVLAVCRRVLSDDPHTADDAFQATFLLLARQAAQVRRPEAVGCWLFGVARRLAQRARVQASRRRTREREAAAYRPEEAPVDPGWSELLAVLDEELLRLPERYRAPLLLCFLEGCTRDEAARRLGWTLSTLRRRLDRGRELLRSRMTTRGATLAGGLWGAALVTEANAAVPPALARAVRAMARAVLGGLPVTGPAAALAEGLVPATSAGRLGAAGVLLAVGVALGFSLLSVFRSPTPPPAPPAPVTATAAEDLPAGARARLGAGRFWHGVQLEAVAFTPDGRLLVGVGVDGHVSLWDADTGRLVRRLLPDAGRSGCRIAFAPDGRTLAAASVTGSLRAFDIETGRELHDFGGTLGGNVAWSPDGNRIATVCGVRNVINGTRRPSDAVVRLWSPDGKPLAELHGHEGDVLAVTFSPDGRTLATAGVDGTVRLWDPETAKERGTFRAAAPGRGVAVTYRPDGSSLAVGCGDGTVRLLDPTTGDEQRRFVAHPHRVVAVAFAPDGATLAAAGADGDVRAWHPDTGAELPPFPRRGSAAVGTLAFSPDGTRLAFAGDLVFDADTARVWDVATRGDAAASDGHRGHVFASAFAPDGRTVVTAGGDGVLIVWDAVTGQVVRRLKGHEGRAEAVAFAPDGRTLVSAGTDGCVRVWDAVTGREARRHDPLWEGWSRPTLAADGSTLAVLGLGTAPRLWAVAGWTERPLRDAHESRLYAEALSCDGRLLATATAGTLRLWETASGRERWRTELPREQRASALAFSPDGTVLATGHLLAPAVGLWDVETGKPRGRLASAEKGPAVTALGFGPDGRTLAVAADGVRLWDVAAARSLLRWQGHQGPVLTLSFSPDGRTLLSGGTDATAVLWHVPADHLDPDG